MIPFQLCIAVEALTVGCKLQAAWALTLTSAPAARCPKQRPPSLRTHPAKTFFRCAAEQPMG